VYSDAHFIPEFGHAFKHGLLSGTQGKGQAAFRNGAREKKNKKSRSKKEMQ
jgi:hypothetical protein